jgi:hypothetical protein
MSEAGVPSNLDEAQQAYEEFLEYKGNRYLTESYLEEGMSEKEARAEVQDPRYLRICLEFLGLEYILKDRWATEGLLNAILQEDSGVLRSLYFYAKKRNPRRKPGPKRDPRTGKYKQESVAELRGQGNTLGQIAKKLYRDPNKAKLVAAHLSQFRRKGAVRSVPVEATPSETPA